MCNFQGRKGEKEEGKKQGGKEGGRERGEGMEEKLIST